MDRIEIINSALKKNQGKSVRSEDLEHYRDFFVDPIHSSILEENTKQLIYGRRGSGKTLVTGAINEKLQAEVQQNNVMSFYYSAMYFRRSAEYGSIIPSIREKTHSYFHAFIELLSYDVFCFADEIFKKPGLLGYFKLSGGDNEKRRDRFITCVLELLEASSYGSENPLPSSLKTTKERFFSDIKKKSKNYGIDGKLTSDLTNIGSGIEAYLNSKGISELESRTISRILYETERSFNPKKIRNLLVEIVKLLRLDYIIIFIDEWMTLAECQVEFAERLKQCLFGEKNISVKIAADPYQGKFNNSGQGHNFRGLEIGADIFEAVNLDLPFKDQTRLSELFTETLYKRLLHFEPELENVFGTSPLVNQEYFIGSIFSSQRAFRELCYSAQGICRDFHEIFQRCTKIINWDVSKQKISYADVRKTIFDKTAETYKRIAESIDSNKLLYTVITPHIKGRQSRYFLMESKPSEYSSMIKDLLSKRIIHDIPYAQMHPSIRGEYECFEIDYGIFIDLARAMEYAGVEVRDVYDPSEVFNITSGNSKHYLLSFDYISENLIPNESETLLCQSCSKEFASDAKAYVVRKICPKCFMDQ